MIKSFCTVILVITLTLGAYAAPVFLNQAPAWAIHKCCCDSTCDPWIKDCWQSACVCQSNAETGTPQDEKTTLGHISKQFVEHRRWIIETVWEAHVLPAMMMMTEQIGTTAFYQLEGIGMQFDAKEQLEVQRTLQERDAETHADYQPSESLCRIATMTRSVANAGRHRDVTQTALSRRFLQRQNLNGDGISSEGFPGDLRSRFAKVEDTFCDGKDLGGAMTDICAHREKERLNADIDFGLFAVRRNLDVNFTESAATPDEGNLMALQSNLYGHKVPTQIPEGYLSGQGGEIVKDGELYRGLDAYMKVRALTAKRSVAQASFAAFTAARAQTDAAVWPYMEALLKEMGVAPQQIEQFFGDNPSYFTQMAVLSNLLYQRPDYYANLYDKPENVDRKIVAANAIGLKLRHDMYDAQVRSNAIASVLLETYIDGYEDRFINEAGNAREGAQLIPNFKVP